VTALTPQRLIGGSWRWATAPVAIVDVVLHVLVKRFEQECAFESHLLNTPVQPVDARAGAVVGVFDVGYAPPEVDAFPVVGGFYAGWEVFGGRGALGCDRWVSWGSERRRAWRSSGRATLGTYVDSASLRVVVVCLLIGWSCFVRQWMLMKQRIVAARWVICVVGRAKCW
jgi:hypothetical protein